MTKKWVLPATLSLPLLMLIGLLSGCQPTETVPAIGEILTLMLTSHEKWSTLSGETLTTWHTPTGETQEVTTLFWIVAPGEGRFEMPTGDTVLIVNDSGVFESYDGGQSFSESHHPDTETTLATLPRTLNEVDEASIYRHPLAMWTASPVVDYVFPAGFAQRSEYEFSGEDRVISRETWVLIFYGPPNGEPRLPLAKYWVDKELGIYSQGRNLRF